MLLMFPCVHVFYVFLVSHVFHVRSSQPTNQSEWRRVVRSHSEATVPCHHSPRHLGSRLRRNHWNPPVRPQERHGIVQDAPGATSARHCDGCFVDLLRRLLRQLCPCLSPLGDLELVFRLACSPPCRQPGTRTFSCHCDARAVDSNTNNNDMTQHQHQQQ